MDEREQRLTAETIDGRHEGWKAFDEEEPKDIGASLI